MKTVVSAAGRQSPRVPHGSAIERAAFALTWARRHSAHHERVSIAKLVYADDKLVSAIVERGAAPIGTTTGSGWVADLSPSLVGEFLTTLAPLSAAAAIMTQGLQVSLGTREMKLPAREGSPSTEVAWVGEGAAIPVHSYILNNDCELSPRKFGFIIGLSRAAAKRSAGEAVVRTLMREDAAATLDGAYFSDVAGDTATHAGMLAGVSALAGWPGGDREAMETDLTSLSDAVTSAGSGTVAFVVSPTRAARIRIKAPDLNRELTFLPSLAVADATIVAVDPLSWAHGFSDDFDIDVSEQATAHMEDTSPGELGAGVAPVRSFFQTDSLALCLIADIAFAPRRPGASAWLQNATW